MRSHRQHRRRMRGQRIRRPHLKIRLDPTAQHLRIAVQYLKTAIQHLRIAARSQKTAIQHLETAARSQKTAIQHLKTAARSQKTAIQRLETAARPQKTAIQRLTTAVRYLRQTAVQTVVLPMTAVLQATAMIRQASEE